MMDGNQIGVVLARVDSVEDPEGEGRVGLRYPWLPDGETLPLSYAPIAAPMSGPSRGFFFMPEEGDEVLVSFDKGDFSHPYVLGFLWNGQHQPPEDKYQNRVILTPGGHTLRFEDGDEKRVILRTDKGHELVLDDQAKEVHLKTDSGLEMSFDETSSTIKIESTPSTVSLSPDGIEMKGGGRTVLLKAGMLQIS